MRFTVQNNRWHAMFSGIMHAHLRNILLLGLAVALLIPLFLWVPTSLRHDPLIGPLGSRYHIGLFMVLTLLMYHRGPLKGRLRLVVSACLLLGVATELLQVRFGRTASLMDWLLNAQGVGFAVCWIWYRRKDRRSLPLLGVGVLSALVIWPLRDLPAVVQEVRAAQERFPHLEDFARPRSLKLWNRLPNIERSLVAVPERGQVLQIDNDGKERWPGVATRKLPWDWTGYTELRVDCRLVAPSPDSLRVTVWIEDRAGRRDVDFAMMTFSVGHQWQTLAVPLAALKTHNSSRAFAGKEVLSLSVFASRRQPGPISFQIDNLRLVSETAGDTLQALDNQDNLRLTPALSFARVCSSLMLKHL